jgi:hypothetical protein
MDGQTLSLTQILEMNVLVIAPQKSCTIIGIDISPVLCVTTSVRIGGGAGLLLRRGGAL